MSAKHRSSGQVAKRAAEHLAQSRLAITPQLPEPTFADSEIDVVPLDLKRDAVKFYITTLQRDNKVLRQIIDEMNKPLAPSRLGHQAKKGKGL